MAKNKQIMTLAWTKHLAPNVLHVALQPEAPFQYIPGQFITLHFMRNETEINRSYSIANPPNTTGTQSIEFAISYLPDGIASEEIFNMKPGELINASGPAGRLILLDEHPKRYVLVATGTGVTPYRSMLNQIQNIIDSQATKFLLLFGVRSPTECLYYQEFLDFKNKNTNNFDFHVFFSREMPKESDNNLHQGYVQNSFNLFNLDFNQDMVYLCGNPNMIDSAYEILLNMGFNARTVRREKYISSK